MVVLFSDPCFLEHETGRHPESAERLRTIVARLQERRLVQQCARGEVRPVSRDDLARLHDPAYITSVQRFAASGGRRIETDTVVSPRSYDVALRAAGAATAAVDRVLTGDER